MGDGGGLAFALPLRTVLAAFFLAAFVLDLLGVAAAEGLETRAAALPDGDGLWAAGLLM